MPPMAPPQPQPPSTSGVAKQATAGQGVQPQAPGQPGQPSPSGEQLSPQQVQDLASVLTPERAQVLSRVVGAVFQDAVAMLLQAAQQSGQPQQGGQVPAGPGSTPQGPQGGPPQGGGLMAPPTT